MLRLELPGADVRMLTGMVPDELGKRLFALLSSTFASESRKHVEFTQDDESATSATKAYKLSRKTLVLVAADELDALKLVIPSIWGKNVTVMPFTADIQELRLAIEALTGKRFNICLANYYNTGADSIAWHSDTEERGSTSCIASVSLGASRMFHFRAIPSSPQAAKTEPIVASLELEHGSLLVMGEGCQETYQHALPRQKECHAPRLNLTFRLFDAKRYES
jgi:alkylated DNA repair dioxygenase AlkB